MVTSSLMVGESGRAAASAPPSASRIFITRAGEGSVPSWGRPLRGRRPAPSLSDRREVRSSSVAPAAAPCLALGREWLRSRSQRRRLPRQLEEVLPPALIAKAGHGLTSNSTAFCPSLPHEFGHGRGPPGSSIRPEVSAAAVRPPEQKSSSSLLLERATAPFVGLLSLRRLPPHQVGLFVPAEVEPEVRL